MIQQVNFLQHQLSFTRVQYTELQSDHYFSNLFLQHRLNYPAKFLYLRAFKQEQLLEVWARDSEAYQLIKTYTFTANSGKPGPKQKEGDLQIPEGFYTLTNFNPESKFHLSIRINYPNHADTVRNKNEKNQGGDIYIHGGNETVGCIPIDDERISELYWLCIKSYTVNPEIPVHIFPCRMAKKNITSVYRAYPANTNFWDSLKPMYSFFQSCKMICEVTGCDDSGNYLLAYPPH